MEQRTDDHGQKRGVVCRIDAYDAQRSDGDRRARGNEISGVPCADLFFAKLDPLRKDHIHIGYTHRAGTRKTRRAWQANIRHMVVPVPISDTHP